MAKPFENVIQDIVYNVDVGIGVRLVKVLLYVLFVVLTAVLYQFSEFRGLKDPEAMDCAQLARNMATRGTYVTQYVRPASMWYLKTHRADGQPHIENHPEIVHPPVYPALLAAVFKTVNPTFTLESNERVLPVEKLPIQLTNHLLTVLAGLFVFLLSRRLFDHRVALLATTAYFLSDTVWAHSVAATSIASATLFVTAALYFALGIAQPEEAPPRTLRQLILPLVLTVLCAALAFLTRYGTVVLVPALAVFIGLSIRPRGWAWALGFVLAFLIAVSPWLARNKVVSGGLLGLAPYTALNETSMFKDDTFERTFKLELPAKQVVQALQTKWFTNMARFYKDDIRQAGDGLFICLFMAALFYRFVRTDVHVFRWCVVLGMALLWMLAGYFDQRTMDLLHTFLPIILVYSAAFFFLLLDRLQLQARVLNFAVVGALMFMGTLPLICTIMPPRASIAYPPYFPPYISHVSQLLEPDELMCTDMPWATAWYGQRNSLHLPVTLDEFYKIHDYEKAINGLYFTTLTRDMPYIRTLATGSYSTWFPILQGQTPGDFPLMEGFPIHNLDQLFLTDRVRWGR